MKTKLLPTKNTLREPIRRAMIALLNEQLADVLDLGLQAKQAHRNVKPCIHTLAASERGVYAASLSLL